jgi:hypothetical protein
MQTFSNGEEDEEPIFGEHILKSFLSIQLLQTKSNIQDLIENYQKMEEMTEGNKPENGKSHKKQTLLIFRETLNIVIQLKRFEGHGQREGFRGNKLRTIVTPNPTITIEEIQFKLIGCCVHLGDSINSGHYTYITFDEQGKEFSTVNDSSEQIRGDKGYVPNQYLDNGYIYLYERKNTA